MGHGLPVFFLSEGPLIWDENKGLKDLCRVAPRYLFLVVLGCMKSTWSKCKPLDVWKPRTARVLCLLAVSEGTLIPKP